jgi:hypothetical protein
MVQAKHATAAGNQGRPVAAEGRIDYPRTKLLKICQRCGPVLHSIAFFLELIAEN